MELTAELLDDFLERMRPQMVQPAMMVMSPRMHKWIYIAQWMSRVSPEPAFKIRKVHMRRMVARRKEAKRRARAAYERRYTFKVDK